MPGASGCMAAAFGALAVRRKQNKGRCKLQPLLDCMVSSVCRLALYNTSCATCFQVLRFWTMHLTRMLGTYVQHTAAAWPQLADLAVNVHAAIAQG
eukprot:366119-Chlamydomonas_euryale.AAC.7